MSEIWKDHKNWIIAGLIGVIVLMTWGGHSSRVGMRNEVLAANAETHSQYRRQADLVPNLVRTVEGSTAFERSILKEVVEARAKATQINVSASDLTDPAKLKAFQDAQGQLGGALSRLLVAVERYPDIKSTAAYRDLMSQLEGTQNRIAAARGRRIKAVRDYNTSLETLTGGFYRSAFGFQPVPQFAATADELKNPVVEFKKS